jgi:hypothetical protein
MVALPISASPARVVFVVARSPRRSTWHRRSSAARCFAKPALRSRPRAAGAPRMSGLGRSTPSSAPRPISVPGWWLRQPRRHRGSLPARVACPSTESRRNGRVSRQGPLPRHAMVARGFKTTSISNSANGTWSAKASCPMSLPFPSNCGNRIETSPNRPSVNIGATHRHRCSGRFRSAHAIARTNATETRPAIGPTTSAKIRLGAELSKCATR